MAELINLNKARKQKARAAAESLAVANRIKFGRTKAEKQRDASAEAEAARRLDGLRRELPPADSSDD
ncbi:DUF4169 family protein [Nevskia ramosa]|uniref:DUF4169 family protein n=1 Tax=Nevskia ramosa TaxID=64002 RepID=UPI0003B4C9B0|nr:DUF4169 family protein [Nevskia ramosa]